MARKNLYINNTNIGTYGIYISSDTILDSPQIDYTAFSVPGKNGSVLQYNKRMENVVRKFTCHVPLRTQVTSALTNLKKLIYSSPGYLKISSDYETDTYQMGYLAQPIDVKPFNVYRTATFDLYFSCRPQKYFNTQTYKNIPNSTTANLRRVLTKSSQFMQNLLNSILSAYVPSDNCFMVFSNASTVSANTSITNISAAWSGGDTFAAACIGQSQTSSASFAELLGYSNEGMSSLSATNTKSGQMLFVVPARTSGTYTFSYTIGGNTTTITSPDLATITTSFSNSNALGVKVSLNLVYDLASANPTVGTFYSNAVVLKYYLQGAEKGECSIVWRTDLMDADMYNTVKDYGTLLDNVYSFDVHIDFDTNEAYLFKTGKPNLPFSNYLEIEGNIPAMGIDEVKAQIFYYGASGRIYGDWWTL